jgi:hypothetical protein
VKEGSRKGASLSAGGLLGEPGGGLLCWVSRRKWGGGRRGRAALSVGSHWGAWKRASLPGTREGSGDGNLSP